MRLLNKYELDLVAGGTTSSEIVVIGDPYFPPEPPSNDDNPDGPGGGGGGNGGGGEPAPPIPVEIAKIIADLLLALPKDAYTQAETATRNLTYYYQGGVNGESVRPDHLDTQTAMNGVTIYVQTESGHLYADRDGDGSVDAHVTYNWETGIVGLDKDADGNPETILGDVSP